VSFAGFDFLLWGLEEGVSVVACLWCRGLGGSRLQLARVWSLFFWVDGGGALGKCGRFFLVSLGFFGEEGGGCFF